MIDACPLCRYSFRGLPADRACPECGFRCDWRGTFLRRSRTGELAVLLLAGAGVLAAAGLSAHVLRVPAGVRLVVTGVLLAGWGLLFAVRWRTFRAFAIVSDRELVHAFDMHNIHRYPIAELQLQADSVGRRRIFHDGAPVDSPFHRDTALNRRWWREIAARIPAAPVESA